MAAPSGGHAPGRSAGDALEQAAGSGGDPRDELFLRHYYRHVPEDELRERAPAELAAAAASHRALAARRPQGTAVVRVADPVAERDGWTSPRTVVQVVTDDMPFLVDSVTAELSRQGRAIHRVLHPTLRVRRDVLGELQEVPAAAGPESLVESWMHVEVGRESDADERAAVEEALRRVLRDVREAVEDWPRMSAAARSVATELESSPPAGVPAEELAEATALLRWLDDGHFTFLGYREYALVSEGGEDALAVVPATGLGILRGDGQVSASFGTLPARVRARARERTVLVLTKANSRATVHRPAYLDYVGVKRFDDAGRVVGERRFLGLFSSAAYTESVTRVPVVRRTAAEVLARSGFAPDSHSGKDLMEILETYPRDELFQVSPDELLPVVLSVQRLQERRQLRLYLRQDAYGRFMSCLVYLPRDRYTTAVRHRLERLLRAAFRASSVDFTARVSESVLARLHFVVRMEPGRTLPEVDTGALEAQLAAATRSWTDDLADALTAAVGEAEAARLLRAYPDAFPEAYKEDFPAARAVLDLQRIDALETQGGMLMDLYAPEEDGYGERRFVLYRSGPVSLSDVLPVLQGMGVEVVDERPYEVQRGDGKLSRIYDFGLRYERAFRDVGTDGGRAARAFQDAFAAVWTGRAESDGFNALVLRAGLDWRQAMVLRAYAKYLRQAGSTFSQDYVEQALASHVGITRLLVRLFESRFDPAFAGAGAEVADGIVEEIGGALDDVMSLDQDRILRAFLGAVRATVRTNHYQSGPDGAPPYLALKLDPQQVPDLPAPRPRHEVWVYSPRVEGVHLRFGAVARGGLRWSDRREDFRTEVLGLVKAQIVKNAVIVPSGAKGGFVVKRPPADPTDRDALLAEGVACYTTFISGLLDVTDNRVQGEAVPPASVVRHDGDDTYLVVAADKGTATFSDIANGVALERGFWLGDAFASGGSAGYDHKAMGITARGAWESVKRHFRELGVDVQSEDVTVVGIGDMSGDVFGNGMLLSRHLRLVAAFDHRHVFLDPDPDPAASWAERRRLYDLPRSSWADYDPALVSPGGGVHPRSAKSVPISPQVRARLGLPAGTTSMTPPQLVNAILKAPVDLFWNGGIGTYVKASTEQHAAAGDKASDAFRVDGAELRCRVVGEGGNLGLTQRGRVEAARHGVLVNTDAIDNSAGVDCSDHEVNIKILLDRVVQDGDLTPTGRDELLVAMTDEVADLVLRDNYEQNVLLANGRVQSHSMLPVHQRFVRDLEERGVLDRDLEALPSAREMELRHAAGHGLTSPELAVLVAYAKISATEALRASRLPDDPWYRSALRGYFPRPLVERYDDRLEHHPLRREIITTCVVNDLVNRAGITFLFRAAEETGATPPEVVRAYTVAREVFGFERYWSAIERLDDRVPTAVQATLYLGGRRLVDRAVRWMLQTRRSTLDVAAEVARFTPVAEQILPRMPELLQGAEAQALAAHVAELTGKGVPQEVARHAGSLLYAFSLFDITELAGSTGRPADEVAELYYALSERYDVDRMLTRITGLPRDDRWQALARSALRYDLYAALRGLTQRVLAGTEPGPPAVRIAAWEADNAEGLERARATLREIVATDVWDLATLSVVLRTMRSLLGR